MGLSATDSIWDRQHLATDEGVSNVGADAPLVGKVVCVGSGAGCLGREYVNTQ